MSDLNWTDDHLAVLLNRLATDMELSGRTREWEICARAAARLMEIGRLMQEDPDILRYHRVGMWTHGDTNA